MNEMEFIIKDILNSELVQARKIGVSNLGYRYYLPNGKSFGRPTEEHWYEVPKTQDFYNSMQEYLTKEVLYLSAHKFSYVTRAGDHNHDRYLGWLHRLGLNNSIGIYKFNNRRIDSFFFICENGQGKQRDLLINNINWLESHVNSLTDKIKKHLPNLQRHNQADFCIESKVCQEIFNNISISKKVSSECINLVLEGKNINISPRELDILKIIKSGESNKYIAYHLGLSEKTVEKILCKLKVKFYVNSKIHLVQIANSPQLQSIF